MRTRKAVNRATSSSKIKPHRRKQSRPGRQSNAILEALRNNILFSEVDSKILAPVLSRITIHRYKPDAVIFDESTRGRYLYLILKGRVRIKKYTKFAVESLLAVLHEGDFFGELSILDGLPRSARAEAIDESVIGFLSASDFRRLVGKRNAFTFNVLKNLALRLRSLDQAFVTELERNTISSRAKLERLRLLIEASKSVNSAIDINTLLDLILTSAARNIHAERGTVYLLNDDRTELYATTMQGTEVKEIRLPVGKGLAGHVALTGETVNIPDAYKDSRFNPEIDRQSGYHTRNVLCMPMKNKEGAIVGVFQFLNRTNGSFTDEDVAFIEGLSVHASIALENARVAQEMMKNERLLTVGKMAGTIIHDIKNPMSILRMYAQLIKRRVNDAEISRFADDMIHQVDRFVKMTQEILDYSRGVTELNLESANLEEVLEAALKFIEIEFRERRIAIARDFTFSGSCLLDPEKIGRVLYNLAGNAADAMPNGGTLTISTSQSNGTAIISVTDTGTGIPDAIRERIFEPFFTHGKRHGTGLGLAIVKKIVDDHKGRIEVESREHAGTTFRIHLPLSRSIS